MLPFKRQEAYDLVLKYGPITVSVMKSHHPEPKSLTNLDSRLHELYNMGLIIKGPKAMCPISKRLSTVWSINEKVKPNKMWNK